MEETSEDEIYDHLFAFAGTGQPLFESPAVQAENQSHAIMSPTSLGHLKKVRYRLVNNVVDTYKKSIIQVERLKKKNAELQVDTQKLKARNAELEATVDRYARECTAISKQLTALVAFKQQ